MVRPGSHPAILTSADRKAELVADLGVDGMCVLPFTPEFSRLTPEEFAHTVLVEHLYCAQVVVGRNFSYGHRAAGTVATLTEQGRRFGFGVEGVDLTSVGSAPDLSGDGEVTISSTYIRACVAAGDMASAALALGRPHRVDGIVVRGDRRGRELGYPTANVESPAHTAVPADGVYAGRLVLRDPGGPAAAATPRRSRSAATRPSAASGARSRRSCSTSRATSTASTWASSSSSGCGRCSFAGVPELLVAMADDVTRTRGVLAAILTARGLPKAPSTRPCNLERTSGDRRVCMLPP